MTRSLQDDAYFRSYVCLGNMQEDVDQDLRRRTWILRFGMLIGNSGVFLELYWQIEWPRL